MQEVQKRIQNGIDAVKEAYKNAPIGEREQVITDAGFKLEPQFFVEQAATIQRFRKAIQQTLETSQVKHPEIRLIVSSETASGHDHPCNDITTEINQGSVSYLL